jgi:beta-lactamase regulating signal transducer with metallopeptidase domain
MLAAEHDPIAAATKQRFGISDIIALISLAGMVYSFISSQSALQTAFGMKLDVLERQNTDLRKVVEPLPMMVYKVDALARQQEEAERQRLQMTADIREMHDGLIAMGITLKGKR